MMNGTDWTGQDVTGWIVQEKFDGHRAFWTGSRLISRSGAPINAPAWFTAGLPAMPLDCELYAGRGGFRKVQSVVKSTDGDWSALRLVCFDAPAVAGGYAARHAAIPANIAAPYRGLGASAVDALAAELAALKANGGEGLMLRNPDAHYTPGRTTELLKLKVKKHPTGSTSP